MDRSNLTVVTVITSGQFVGDGSGLSGLNGTNLVWDVDVLTAPATTGAVAWSEGASGNTYANTEVEVWPIYSNAVGRVFGTSMEGSYNSGGETYHVWTWDAQPGAVGYLLRGLNVTTDETTYKEVAAGTLSINFGDLSGGSNIDPKPSSVARTNDVLSTWLPTYNGADGTQAMMLAMSPLTNAAATVAQLVGATSAIPINPVLQASNRTAYADPQFPLWSPPYFGNIQSALTWLGSASFADGTVSNHGVLKISGQWSVSGNRIQVSSDKYDWIEIDASGAAIECNVASVGNEYGWLDFNTGVDRVRINGGRWRAWQNSNNNGQLIKIRGPYASLSDMDVWTAGSNWNQTCGIRVDGAFATADGIRASIASTANGSGGYTPVQINGSSCLVQRSSWDMWAKPNSFLGHAAGNGRQFVNCTFRGYNYSANYPLFFNVGEGDRWENCTFANVVNPTFATNAPWPVIGRTSETPRNFYVNNCIFNQIDWYTNHVPAISNNVMISTNYPGIVVPKME